ncbi:20210_t:CDS:2, partial [Entrophospora sp. SA101]
MSNTNEMEITELFGTFHTNVIIGKPFGHSYEIYDKDKVKIIKNVSFIEVDETEANNQEIFDDPSKQKLSYKEIEQLKQQATEGSDVIKNIVESHISFDKKTEYSKAKYIKHFQEFLRQELRIDTLSQMLKWANVHSNTRMLVVDDTQGLVITGIMERLG